MCFFRIFYYFIRNNKIEIKINNVHRKTDKLCKTLSDHLLVTSHIQPHILVRFKETCLFCINIDTINKTATTTSAIDKKSNIIFI